MTERTATVRTAVERPSVVAAAVRPDNTVEMTTRVDDDAVVTTVTRPDTGGLRSTLDDYAVNLQVATAAAQHADRHRHQTHE